MTFLALILSILASYVINMCPIREDQKEIVLQLQKLPFIVTYCFFTIRFSRFLLQISTTSHGSTINMIMNEQG